MPHVIAVLVTGAGLYAGWKWISRQIAPPKRDASAAGQGPRTAPKDLGTLDRDPVSGVYRPRAD